MPGILPMKVIKVGTSSQSRIAQACDRCRSKKIRCDGIRPTCSQCSSVGFECRTSDKLSRRAFPRGYTESLEERVRVLEAEVRDLKDLLDEKDEKIDVLSKMHGHHHQHRSSPGGGQSMRRPSSDSSSSSPSSSAAAEAVRREAAVPPVKEDTFRIQASPLLLGVENSDSYFMGASSGRAFIETFKRKIQENGKSCSDFNTEAFLHIQGCYPLVANAPAATTRAPPRLFSDRCVNVYFQEWAPLFPVLHKPAFLRIYEDFVADSDKIKNNHKLAQLYLVFSIAALSGEQTDLDQIAACEQQWQRALEAVLMDNTIITLQCLVLALMYCAIRADYKRLQHYKGIAVTLSHRLGLHQSQKRFSFGALTIETRKKVFWTLYTLDCFSAAILGLPKLLKEADVHTEFPSDTDDEYVTEKGFQPTLPGEYTKLSSALALFRAARILGKVLEKIYPAATTHEVSLQQMHVLEAELDEWLEALPQHLRLTFKQDKPSTDVTGSRSPLLALTYYYIRTLILRPAVGSSLGGKAAPCLLAVGEAAKHVVQIVQLLEERGLCFALCLNKGDVLTLCGMTLLYQALDLGRDSRIARDNERLVNAIIRIVDRVRAPGAYDFTRVAAMLVSVDEPPPQPEQQQAARASLPTPPHQSPKSTTSSASSSSCGMAAPPARLSPPAVSSAGHGGGQQPQPQPQKKRSTYGQLYQLRGASASETDLLLQQEKMRRMTMPASGMAVPDLHRKSSRASFDSQRDAGPYPPYPHQHQHHRMSMSHAQMLARITQHQQLQDAVNYISNKNQNLDFLNLSDVPSQPASPVLQQQPSSSSSYLSLRGGGGGGRLGHGMYHHAAAAAKPGGMAAASASSLPPEWEGLLSEMDLGHLNIHNAIYGGDPTGLGSLSSCPPSSTATATTATSTTTAATTASSSNNIETPLSSSTTSLVGGGGGDCWSPDGWDLTVGLDLSDFAAGEGPGGVTSSGANHPAPPQSVLSLSDESLSPADTADLMERLGFGLSDHSHSHSHGYSPHRSSIHGHMPATTEGLFLDQSEAFPII